MTSKSRPQRKRKQYEQFSPMLPEEEKELKEALSVSLRRIPENGNVSEDDCDESDNKKEDDYEIKWRDIRQQVTVNEFNQPSGPTKVLSDSKKIQKFFDLIFSRKIWTHLCQQTNLYAQQTIQTTPDPDWVELCPRAKGMDLMFNCNGVEQITKHKNVLGCDMETLTGGKQIH